MDLRSLDCPWPGRATLVTRAAEHIRQPSISMISWIETSKCPRLRVSLAHRSNLSSAPCTHFSEYFASTNDDGWLVGGGEPGPPRSYKLPAEDSAHVEIMRVGTFKPEWGGIAEKDIIA